MPRNLDKVTKIENVTLDGVKGAIIGDNARQTNNYEININIGNARETQPAPSTNETKPQHIDLDIAAACFDRTTIFPEISSALSVDRVNTVFVLGYIKDWHDAICTRLSLQQAQELPIDLVSHRVIWPSSKSQVLKERELWRRTMENYTGLSVASYQPDKKDYQDTILDFFRKQASLNKHSYFYIHYDIQSFESLQKDLPLLQSIHTQWQSLHLKLQDDIPEHHFAHIGLLFMVKEKAPKNLLGKLYNSVFDGRNKIEQELKTKIHEVIEDASFYSLPLVSSDDIDAWFDLIKHNYETQFPNQSWWYDIKSKMSLIFENEEKLHHRELKHKLEKNTEFLAALQYKDQDLP